MDFDFKNSEGDFTNEKNRSKWKIEINEGESIRKESIEESFNLFLIAFEKKDTEEISHQLEFLGQSSNTISNIDFQVFQSQNIFSKLIEILSSMPPPNVIQSIYNIFTSIINIINPNEVSTLFESGFFEITVQLLLEEDSEDELIAKHRIYIFLNNLVLISQELRDIVINCISLQLFFDKFNETLDRGLKIDILLFLSKAAFWPQFPYFEDLLSFIFSIFNEATLDILVIGMQILYYLEMNNKTLLNQINERINVDFNKVLGALSRNRLCEFPMKLLSDLISLRRNNDEIDIMLLIDLYLDLETDYPEKCRNICIINTINLIIAISNTCESPFTHEELVLLISKSRDLMRDSQSKLKIKAALLIGEIFKHFTNLELERIVQFDIVKFISPILLMCSGEDLIRILQWIFELFTRHGDLSYASYLRDAIENSELSDTLDEIADSAEEENNKEVLEISSSIKLLIDFGLCE